MGTSGGWIKVCVYNPGVSGGGGGGGLVDHVDGEDGAARLGTGGYGYGRVRTWVGGRARHATHPAGPAGPAASVTTKQVDGHGPPLKPPSILHINLTRPPPPRYHWTPRWKGLSLTIHIQFIVKTNKPQLRRCCERWGHPAQKVARGCVGVAPTPQWPLTCSPGRVGGQALRALQ